MPRQSRGVLGIISLPLQMLDAPGEAMGPQPMSQILALYQQLFRWREAESHGILPR
jgi:hypothetical protein